MPHLLADRVKETTTTTGTGAVTLLGAVAGFRTFEAVLANGDTTLYAIIHQTVAEWEVGIGTWNTGGTLTRSTVIASSNAGALVNFSAAVKDVFITFSPTGPIALSSYMNLAEISEPAAPQSQSMRLYAEDRLGRTVMRAKTPGGNRFQLMQDNVVVMRNQTGITIPIFTPVYESGTGASGEPLITLADADSIAALPAVGLTVEAIPNNSNGFVMLQGVLHDIPTAGFSVGDILYVSTTAGALTTVEPQPPNLSQRVARVLASHATLGAALIIARQPTGRALNAQHFTGQSAVPALPAVGSVSLFSLLRGGRPTLNIVTGSGRDYALQPWLATNKIEIGRAHV